MIDFKQRVYNTICEIEYSSQFDNNWELFYKGVEILTNKLNSGDDSFDDSELEILENIFIIMEEE